MQSGITVKFCTGAAFVLTLAAAPAALATVDYFLKIDGIPGESIDAAHVDEIEVLAWSWGAAIQHPSGSGKTVCTNAQDLSFTHYFDKASPKLAANLIAGQVSP